MSSDLESPRAHLKRVPQQERSQVRFEAVVGVALRLIGEHGYEAVSMREIAREAGIPIASVYQYFPTKLAIVKEIWLRYSLTLREHLTVGLQEFVALGEKADAEHMIEGMVDLMTTLQLSSPAYVEIWGCVAASPELRTLNDEDTLLTTGMVVDAIMAVHPAADRDLIEGMALVMSEAAEAITKLTLSLAEGDRTRLLGQTKRALKFLYKAAVAKGGKD